MNIVTGFRWFSNIFGPCALTANSHSIGRVKIPKAGLVQFGSFRGVWVLECSSSQLRRIDVSFCRESLSSNIDFKLSILKDEIIGDIVLFPCSLVNISHKSQADVAVEREAVRAGCGCADVFAVPVDGFTAPRPAISIVIVFLDQELTQPLFDAFILLPQ